MVTMVLAGDVDNFPSSKKISEDTGHGIRSDAARRLGGVKLNFRGT